MQTRNFYYNLAMQKIARGLLSCVSLHDNQNLARKAILKKCFALQNFMRRLELPHSRFSLEQKIEDSSNRKKLAAYYAKHFLKNIMGIEFPQKTMIELYARQLLKHQEEIVIEEFPDSCYQALIISPDPFEQNIFSTLLRSLQILPIKAENKTGLLKHLKNHYDIVIFSEKFEGLGAHAIAQIFNTSGGKPLLIMLSQNTEANKRLGFELTLQHPFSLERLSIAISTHYLNK